MPTSLTAIRAASHNGHQMERLEGSSHTSTHLWLIALYCSLSQQLCCTQQPTARMPLQESIE